MGGLKNIQANSYYAGCDLFVIYKEGDVVADIFIRRDDWTSYNFALTSTSPNSDLLDDDWMSVAQFKTNWGTNHDMYRINSWGTGDWSNYKFQKWRLHDYMIQTDGDESEKTVFFNNSVNADGEIPLSEIGMSFLDDKVGIGTTDPQQKLHIYKDLGSTEPTEDRQTLLLLEGQYTDADFEGALSREGGVGITFKLGNKDQTNNPGYAAQIMAHCDERDTSEHKGALSFWTSTTEGLSLIHI